MAQRVQQAVEYVAVPIHEAPVTPRLPWEEPRHDARMGDGLPLPASAFTDALTGALASALPSIHDSVGEPARAAVPFDPKDSGAPRKSALPTGPGDPRVQAAFTAGPVIPRPGPSSMRHVAIPELYCPFDPAVHPKAATVHAASVAWAMAMGLARDDKHVQALHTAKVGWLVARAFPIADQMDALQIAADWITLFCLIDNHIESIRGPALSHVYLKSLLNVFRDGAAPLIVDPFAQAFRDLRERMIAVNVPFWITRFGDQLQRLFGTFVDEAKWRQLEAVPDMVRYRKMREVSSGLYFGFRLGELTDNINLPPHVREHATVKLLESKASLIVGLANDIYTVERELARGEVNNMVMVLMHDEGLTVEQAMTRTVEMHDAETREFIALAVQLPRFSPQVDSDLQRYVDVLSSMISGHRSWAIETARYTPGADPDGRA